MYSGVPGWKIERDKKIDGHRVHFFLTNNLSSLKVVVQAKDGPTLERADVELLAQLRELTKADRATLCHEHSAKVPPDVEAFVFQKGLELRPVG
jgi:hypothetical protein